MMSHSIRAVRPVLARSLGMLLMGGLATCAARAEPPGDSGVKIDLPAPAVVTKKFDPKRPPGDMPKLTPPEAAVTQSYYACQTEVEVSVTEEEAQGGSARARVTVTGVKFQGKLDVTIWVPTNGSRKITAHEEGHRKIAEMYYAKAGPAVRAAAERVVGGKFEGKGKTTQLAVKDAIGKALERVNDAWTAATTTPATGVQRAYDRITAHGTNRVAEEEAIKRAVKEAGGQ